MDEQMQKVRGVEMMGRYGRYNDNEDLKLHDFLAIFHPEMTTEQREAFVRAAQEARDE